MNAAVASLVLPSAFRAVPDPATSTGSRWEMDSTLLLSADGRRSIAERYKGRQDYLNQVELAARDLVGQHLMLASDVPAVLQRAAMMWDGLARN